MCLWFLRFLFLLLLLVGGSAVLARTSPAHPFDLADLCPDSPHVTALSNRLFFGKFIASGGRSAQDHLLIVTDVASLGHRLLFYVWGAQPSWGVESPGCIPVTAQESGRVLSFIHVDRTVRYEEIGPNGLRAVYRWASGEVSGLLRLVEP